MTEFLAAIALFLLAHVVPPAPPVRARLVATLGRRAYLALYSLLSLALIAWVVRAAMRAPYLPLWEAAPWHALVPLVLMPIAAWLVVAGLWEANPLSVSLQQARDGDALPPITAVTRHPLLWGLLLWALAHVPPNGDLVSLILFGGMAALAVGGMFVLDRRKRRTIGEQKWRAMAGRSGLVPFAALATGRARLEVGAALLWPLALAAALYLWFLLDGHRRLIGPDPLAKLG